MSDESLQKTTIKAEARRLHFTFKHAPYNLSEAEAWTKTAQFLREVAAECDVKAGYGRP